MWLRGRLEFYVAAGWPLETRHRPQQRGFSTTAWPDQKVDLTGCGNQVNVIDRRHTASELNRQ